MTVCPTCHQEVVEHAAVLVSLDENTLTFRGDVVKLKPTQAEVAAVLVRHMRHTVTRGRLVEQVWGAAETAWSSRGLDQHIMQLRRALRPIGLDISTTWGRGYRLDVA